MTDTVLDIDTSTIPSTMKRSNADFTVIMQPPLRFRSLAYNLVLKSLSTFYSIPNFDFAKYTNTEFYVSEVPGGSNPDINLTITIPDGIYSFEDFKDEFERQQALGGFSGTPITFTVNRNTGKFQMVVEGTCQIAMSITSAVMFGFYNKTLIAEYNDNGKWWSNSTTTVVYTSATTTTSTFTPEWSMGTLSLNLETDITTNSIANGKSANVIANFSPSTVPFGKIVYEPINPVYLQIGTRAISGMKIKITDQSGNIVNLRDEVDMLFVIRPFGMGS